MARTTYLFPTSYFSSCQMLMAFSCHNLCPMQTRGRIMEMCINIHVRLTESEVQVWLSELLHAYIAAGPVVLVLVWWMQGECFEVMFVRKKVHQRQWVCRGVWFRAGFVPLNNAGSSRSGLLTVVGDALSYWEKGVAVFHHSVCISFLNLWRIKTFPPDLCWMLKEHKKPVVEFNVLVSKLMNEFQDRRVSDLVKAPSFPTVLAPWSLRA